MHDPTLPPLRFLRAVCFDWAGTTVDFGCQGPVSVFASAFAAEGVSVTDEEVRAPMGMGKRDHLQQMLAQPSVAARWRAVHHADANPTDIDRLYARFLPLQVATVADHAAPIEGVPALLTWLLSQGLRVGGTTGYASDVMAVLAPLAAQAGYAPHANVTVDDVAQGRPAPDQLLACLRLLGDIDPADAVAVDDTVTGVKAGRNAGMWTVGVAASGNLVGLTSQAYWALDPYERAQRTLAARQQLLDAGAHDVVDVVTDLPPLLARFDAWRAQGRVPEALDAVVDE